MKTCFWSISWGWLDITIEVLGQNYTCGLIFRPVPLQSTENWNMGSPMGPPNNFWGLIWHHHSNPWSKLYLWSDCQTCTPSDHREQGHGVPHGGPEQLLGADLTWSFKSLVNTILVVWFSDLYPFRPQRTVTCCSLSVQLCESDKMYPYLNPNNLKRGGAGDSKFKWELQETWYYIAKVRNPADGEGQTSFGPNMCENS